MPGTLLEYVRLLNGLVEWDLTNDVNVTISQLADIGGDGPSVARGNGSL